MQQGADASSTGSPAVDGSEGAEGSIESNGEPVSDQPDSITPLRPVRYASNAKQILAVVIKSVYTHFRGPTCQLAARRLDGMSRFLLRKNSKAAAMEPLLVYALLQGNASSVSKFATDTNLIQQDEVTGDGTQAPNTSSVPAGVSPTPGIYEPSTIVAYIELGELSSIAAQPGASTASYG